MLPNNATYESIYNQQLLELKSKEAGERHRLAANKLSQVTLAGNLDHHDHIAQILTMGILLHTTDFLELDDPKSVEDVQAMYASLLWR